MEEQLSKRELFYLYTCGGGSEASRNTTKGIIMAGNDRCSMYSSLDSVIIGQSVLSDVDHRGYSLDVKSFADTDVK